MSNSPLHSPAETPSFRAALPAVLFVALIFFMNYTNRAILGPLLVYMEESLGLDHVQSTSFILLLSTGFCIGVICSGVATSKVKPRLIIALSAICGGGMLLVLSRAESVWGVRIPLALVGFSSGFYMTAALATLDSLARKEDWSRVIGVHELSPAISFIISPILAETTARLWGWQGAMVFTGCLSMTAGTLFLLFGKGGEQKTERPSASGIIEAFKHGPVWIFIWLFAMGIAGEFAPFSVLTLSLTAEQGLESEAASHLLSLSRLPSPFAALAGGFATTRLGTKRTILLFLLTQGISLLVMALPLSLIGMPIQFTAMACQAASTAFVFPALFTFFARSFPYNQQPILPSLSLPMASYVATGIFPFLLGACGEYLTFSFGYAAFGAVTLLSILILVFMNRAEE